MNRSIEQTLLSLMPTHSSALPPQLVELAGSLLGQSRHRASTLKAEEEVARLYACAHIACDRLKISLNLPPIEGRPPIPPRIYKRLYTHLDKILPNVSTNRSTPGKARTPGSRLRDVGSSPATGKPLPSRATPGKDRSLSQFRTPSAAANGGTPTKSTGKATVPSLKSKLRPWIQPTIRFMCKQSGQPGLAPSILAGMDYIVTSRRKTSDEWITENLTGLCAAIYFFASMRAKNLSATVEKIDRHNYLPIRKEILALLARAREEVVVNGQSDEEAWEGWQSIASKDVDRAVQEVQGSGWLDADWFSGILDIAAEQQPLEGDGDGPDTKLQARRADTMFQDRYDFLSEKKREEYSEWKAGILMRITQLEDPAPDAMEVDK